MRRAHRGDGFYRNMYNLNNYITNKHFVNMGYVMMMLAAAIAAILHSQNISPVGSGSAKWESRVIDKLFAERILVHLFANAAGILLPVLIVAIPATVNPT